VAVTEVGIHHAPASDAGSERVCVELLTQRGCQEVTAIRLVGLKGTRLADAEKALLNRLTAN